MPKQPALALSWPCGDAMRFAPFRLQNLDGMNLQKRWTTSVEKKPRKGTCAVRDPTLCARRAAAARVSGQKDRNRIWRDKNNKPWNSRVCYLLPIKRRPAAAFWTNAQGRARGHPYTCEPARKRAAGAAASLPLPFLTNDAKVSACTAPRFRPVWALPTCLSHPRACPRGGFPSSSESRNGRPPSSQVLLALRADRSVTLPTTSHTRSNPTPFLFAHRQPPRACEVGLVGTPQG